MHSALHSFPTRRSSDLIMPEGFNGTFLGGNPAGWVPMSMHDVVQPNFDWYEQRRGLFLFAFGRLKPDVSVEQAAANLRGIFGRSEEHTSELQSPCNPVCTQHYTLSLHDALPISSCPKGSTARSSAGIRPDGCRCRCTTSSSRTSTGMSSGAGSSCSPSAASSLTSASNRRRQTCVGYSVDRKSTRLNSSHLVIPYALSTTLFPYTTLFRSHHARRVQRHVPRRESGRMGADVDARRRPAELRLV